MLKSTEVLEGKLSRGPARSPRMNRTSQISAVWVEDLHVCGLKTSRVPSSFPAACVCRALSESGDARKKQNKT